VGTVQKIKIYCNTTLSETFRKLSLKVFMDIGHSIL